MSRSAARGNAFLSDNGDTESDRPLSPPPAKRAGSLRSQGRSDEYSEERSDERLSDKRSLRTDSEGHRRAESFGEKTDGYERGYAAQPAHGPSKQPVTNYTGSFAPNPSFIRLLRFLLYGLASLSALATAGVAISVAQWYNSHTGAIAPSWGSMIALIVFGIITPGAYFATFLITPRLFRYGTVLGIVNQVRVELLLVFGLAVIWVSGALAMANDLRGYENCIWDGYYHTPEPSDFHHVCDLINATVIMGYVTFGLVTLTWFVVTAIAVYILLYLDQEVLSELTNDMGGRAYRARTFARQEVPPPRQSQFSGYNGGGYNPSAGAGMMHRRASSSGSRRSRDYDDFEAGGAPSQYGTAVGNDAFASRQIPNPDAAVPMNEKQALANRYAQEPTRRNSDGGDGAVVYHGYERQGDVERGGPMMQATPQEERANAARQRDF